MQLSLFVRRSLLAGIALSIPLVTNSSLAAPPWAKLIPYTKVDADPEKDYELTESHGPWMIMCTSFTGVVRDPKSGKVTSADEQAHDLVLELRQKHKLQAFIYRKHFDMGQPEIGLGMNKYGGQKIMRHSNAYKRDEIAVLVGNFHSVDQPEIEKVLQNIKTMLPDTLNSKKTGEKSLQSWGTLRGMYRETTKMLGKKEKGPMGNAFITRNPMLPEEYFTAKGLDPFVVELNQHVKYSLLKCPGKYTVKVASFRGVETMKPKEFDQLVGQPYTKDKSEHHKGMAKIDIAADNASRMTKALRDKGVEAYEFHDRTESMVCVGSFDSVGEPRDDGKIEINPGIHRLMETYAPEKQFVPGQAQAFVKPREILGIPFDPQPLPVVVPRQSIANDYVRRVSHEE
ncbi:MAG: hypothetical protein ACKVP0_06205 [Pirellulaceae bacterium]